VQSVRVRHQFENLPGFISSQCALGDVLDHAFPGALVLDVEIYPVDGRDDFRVGSTHAPQHQADTAQVTAIQGSTQEAVDTIKGIGQIIDKMSEIATMVAAAVEEQGAATAEIARNIQQAAAGTQNVSQNIEGVSNAANQSGETASDVLQSSDGLAAESEALSNEVGRFLARIKAA
jgi:ABC-type transporter Mla subunit MlaD